MKRILFLLLLIVWPGLAAMAPAQNANAQPAEQLILSKQGGGPITRNSLSLTLASGPNCDQTQTRIPDGSKMVSDGFTLNVNDRGLGTFYGSVRIVTARDEILHVGILRGTVGINDCDPSGGTVCPAVCNSPWRLDGIYEPAPTFAPNPNGEIVLANFKAYLDPRVAGPLPVYRARLDGWFSPPPSIAQRIRLAPEKFVYLASETIRVAVTNASDRVIRGYDLRSRCSILELQRQDGNQWAMAGQCFLRRVPFPMDIKPGETATIELSPAHPAAAIPPGVYRAALGFHAVNDDKTLSDFLFSFSPQFRVSSMPEREAVNVSVDRDRYLVGQPIVVTVDNNTDRAIQTTDHQTNCSIVTLQRLRDGNWTAVAECPLASPTRPVNLASRQRVTIELPAAPFTGSFEPGVYRIEFSYAELEGARQNPGVKRYSPQFSIAPKE
jgi:hypothetical protein